MKETLTLDEIGMLAKSVNTKVRDIESWLKVCKKDDVKMIEQFEKELSGYKLLQDKMYRMHKNF